MFLIFFTLALSLFIFLVVMAPIHKDATVDILLIIFDKIIVGRLLIIVIWGEILFFIYLWSLFDHPIRSIFFIAGIEWLG